MIDAIPESEVVAVLVQQINMFEFIHDPRARFI